MNNNRQPLFRLAVANLKTHKWINAKLCLVFVCMSVLVCLFTAFNMSVESRRNEFFSFNTSANYMYANEDKSEFLRSNGFDDFDYCVVERYNLSKLMQKYVQANVPTVTTNYIALTIGASEKPLYYCKDTSLLWMYRGSPFNNADVKELSERFGKTDVYVGDFPEDNTHEALVSEKLLDSFGLTANDVLGKQLGIWLGDREHPVSYLTVTGIIVREYYELSGHMDDSWQIVPSLVFASNVSLPSLTDTDVFHIYVMDSWRTLSVDELNKIISDGHLTYCGITSYNQRVFLDNIRIVVVNVYYIIGSFLVAGLLFTVMLMMDKFTAVFSRIGGILLACGLEQINLHRLLFSQVLLLVVLSIPLASVGALVGYAVIVELIAVGTGLTMTVSTSTLLILLAISTLTVFVSATAFFGAALLKLRKKTVKELLVTDVQ